VVHGVKAAVAYGADDPAAALHVRVLREHEEAADQRRSAVQQTFSDGTQLRAVFLNGASQKRCVYVWPKAKLKKAQTPPCGLLAAAVFALTFDCVKKLLKNFSADE
jgi:hypothetical protein